ncbi:2-keto-4-pentenoate hydratase/2-oxohepta-3-ene-1,7-dioic acid hydratase (catechol pathway) [Flexibacter flexilis DSM 6793]|uniref:2-keto-4-pentenoate hydratase/2-oxohepta-3-ene-1,7-dioic acid hydratase (Catechol pathway) n=1 Tax=Flexibacter flexilis DSM 6793 TaxID=927664 RepID=A0A1I1HS29_9BACT|nr:fumarylacetoacetate hydrolase family protein [Flexibacter flexilis]SFC26939.1 2-keto-4-pentenoate hydratase/2-oxohepta-3-ene-1,7-dioic acid hydratase (catechol pathway) [Flexibacter flexilis DSM 6793]
MKIFAIGRNYADHVKELNNERPESPVVFMKPDTALLRENAPFYYPDFSQDVHHEVEIVLKVCKEGKHIDEKFAHKYYDELAIGIDFTARDLQQKLKEKGLPWEIAKGFNGSAPVSNFVPVSQFTDLQNINFSLNVNGQLRQQGNTQMMMYRFDYIVSYLSKFFTLKKGDLIFTGTPAGVAPVQIGDRLEAAIEGEVMLDFLVK